MAIGLPALRRKVVSKKRGQSTGCRIGCRLHNIAPAGNGFASIHIPSGAKRHSLSPYLHTFILEVGWMSSVIETLSCWSLLLTSLEQQMLTELRTCQELYSTKERLSMTRVPSAPFRRRLASFFGSITLRGSLSPAITGPSALG